MEELDRNKEEIDKDLAGLEEHAPSMRFAKNLVEKVKLETDIIRPEKNPLQWIPKALVGSAFVGFSLLVYALVKSNSTVNVLPEYEVWPFLSQALLVSLGVVLFLGFDRFLKRFLVKSHD